MSSRIRRAQERHDDSHPTVAPGVDGLLPASSSLGHFLRDDGSWAAPVGGGAPGDLMPMEPHYIGTGTYYFGCTTLEAGVTTPGPDTPPVDAFSLRHRRRLTSSGGATYGSICDMSHSILHDAGYVFTAYFSPKTLDGTSRMFAGMAGLNQFNAGATSTVRNYDTMMDITTARVWSIPYTDYRMWFKDSADPATWATTTVAGSFTCTAFPSHIDGVTPTIAGGVAAADHDPPDDSGGWFGPWGGINLRRVVSAPLVGSAPSYTVCTGNSGSGGGDLGDHVCVHTTSRHAFSLLAYQGYLGGATPNDCITTIEEVALFVGYAPTVGVALSPDGPNWQFVVMDEGNQHVSDTGLAATEGQALKLTITGSGDDLDIVLTDLDADTEYALSRTDGLYPGRTGQVDGSLTYAFRNWCTSNTSVMDVASFSAWQNAYGPWGSA